MVSAEPRREMVYVMSFMGYHKIGRTSNIEQRMRSILPTAFPVEPTLELLIEVPNSSVAESVVHSELASQRVRGEWFKLANGDIERISEIIRSVNYSRERLGKAKPKTPEYISRIISNKIALGADAVPLRYACHVLRNLKRGRQVAIATNDIAVIRSIERKFKLRLWFGKTNCDVIDVTKVDDL